MKGKLRKLAVLGSTLAAFLAAGVVFAAWTVPGTGEGYSKASSAQALTTNDSSASTSSQLYPGGQGHVKLEISNPNPFPVTVTRVEQNGPVDSDKTNCTNVGGNPTKETGVSFSTQNPASGNVVPANGTLTMTFNNAASMSNQSVDACQGAVFNIPVTLTAAS
jgi:hypothetical protein